MKRLLCTAFSALLLLSPLAAAPMASAAQAPIRVIGYEVRTYKDNPTFYLDLVLDTKIGDARHFQTQEKKPEDEVPEDAFNFDALLTDAGRNCVLVDDVSIGEYMDGFGSTWSPSLHFEKKKEDKNIQHFTLSLAAIPSIEDFGYKKNDFTVTIADGMISREHWKFEPLVAKWNAKTQKFTIYREGDDGLTLEQALNGEKTTAKPTTTKKTDKTTTTQKGQTTTKNNTTTGKTTSGASGDTTTTTSGTGTDVTGEDTTPVTTAPTSSDGDPEEIIPTLGSFDITSNSKDVVIDFPNKVVTLAKPMTVKEFLGTLSAVEGYELGVYNGTLPIEEGESVVEGYKFKVRVDDKLIGNFLIKAPASSGNTLVLVLCIVGGVLVLAAAGVLVYIFVIRKKKAATLK